MHAPFRTLLALIAWMALVIPWQVCSSDCHEPQLGIVLLHGCHDACPLAGHDEVTAHDEVLMHDGVLADAEEAMDVGGSRACCELSVHTDVNFLASECTAHDLVILAPRASAILVSCDVFLDWTSRLLVSDVPRPPPFGPECLRSVVLHL